MRNVTLAQLRDRIRRRADILDDGEFITDAELNDYVNESISDLYDLILESENSKFFVQNAPIMQQVGLYGYELPSNFYKVTSVHLFLQGHYMAAYPADPRDYAVLAVNAVPVDEANLAVTYIPNAPLLTDDADTWDGFSGWEEYVIVDVAIKALDKQDMDASQLMRRKSELGRRISEHASYIDTGVPDVIRELPDPRNKMLQYYVRSDPTTGQKYLYVFHNEFWDGYYLL